jgi:hypothetical protein
MGIIADMLIPGRRSQGFILGCVIGIAGAAVSCVPAIVAIQPVPPVRPPLSRVRVIPGDRARWPAWRLVATALRNGAARKSRSHDQDR